MQHHHVHDELSSPQTPFKKAIFIALFFMSVEIIGGIVGHSLALITDALHLFTDVGSLLLALVVVRIVALPKSQKMSYGYHRAEIIGALFSSLFLLTLCGFLLYSAVQRLFHPQIVTGEVVFVVAVIGLLANIWMMRILHPTQGNDLNTRTAYLHILGDLLASIGVILSAVLIWFTGWNEVDPLLTIAITAFLCWNTAPVIKKSVRILMQGTPEDVDMNAITETLKSIPGVLEVHDLHLWSVSSKRVALSTHLIVDTSHPAILQEVHRLIETQYDIHHMTVQLEEANQFESRFCYDTDS